MGLSSVKYNYRIMERNSYLNDKRIPWCRDAAYIFAFAAVLIFSFALVLALVLYFLWHRGLPPFSKKKFRKRKPKPAKPKLKTEGGLVGDIIKSFQQRKVASFAIVAANPVQNGTTHNPANGMQPAAGAQVNPEPGVNTVSNASSLLDQIKTTNPSNELESTGDNPGSGIHTGSKASNPSNDGSNLNQDGIAAKKLGMDSSEQNNETNNAIVESKNSEQDGISIIPLDNLETVPEETIANQNETKGVATISVNVPESVISVPEEPGNTDGEQENQNLHM